MKPMHRATFYVLFVYFEHFRLSRQQPIVPFFRFVQTFITFGNITARIISNCGA